MFDFIKRMFSPKDHSAQAAKPGAFDVVERNDIEVMKTSDYKEGAPAQALEAMVKEEELRPAELDLPAAELDEPSSEPDMPPDIVPTDNYLSGELSAARLLRDQQTRRAGLAHWDCGLAKYRPRVQRYLVDGSNAKDFHYFQAIQLAPKISQNAMPIPEMTPECVNLYMFIRDALKGKMVSEFVSRSMESIREQQENGQAPLGKSSNSKLREMLSDYETDAGNIPAKEQSSRSEDQTRPENPTNHQIHFENNVYQQNQKLANTWTQPDLQGNFELVEELFQPDKEIEESYTRWLLTVAEEAHEADDVLWLLVHDLNPDVRFCLAENYDIDPAMLSALSEDENPYVAHRAQQTLMRSRAPGKVLDRKFRGSAQQVLKNG
jgi:hypothetical protein